MRLTQILCGKLSDKVGEITKRYSNLPDSYIQKSMEQVSFFIFYNHSL